MRSEWNAWEPPDKQKEGGSKHEPARDRAGNELAFASPRPRAKDFGATRDVSNECEERRAGPVILERIHPRQVRR
jgi:hypothetical protein